MQGNRRRKMSKKRESGVQWMNPLQLVFGCICAVTGLLGLLISPPGTAMAALGAYRTLAAAGLGGALVCGGLATVDAKGVRLWKLGARVRLDWKDVRSVAAFTVSERGAQLPYLLVSSLEAPWDAPMPRFDLRKWRNFWRDGAEATLILNAGARFQTAFFRHCPLTDCKAMWYQPGTPLCGNGRLLGPDEGHARPRKAARKEKKP